MSESKFKLIESLGLESSLNRQVKCPCGTQHYYHFQDAVSAKDLERILEKGVRVVGNNLGGPNARWETGIDGTHTALLIDIKPIVRERRRSLSESEVRELISQTMDNQSDISTEITIERLFGREGE